MQNQGELEQYYDRGQGQGSKENVINGVLAGIHQDSEGCGRDTSDEIEKKGCLRDLNKKQSPASDLGVTHKGESEVDNQRENDTKTQINSDGERGLYDYITKLSL